MPSSILSYLILRGKNLSLTLELIFSFYIILFYFLLCCCQQSQMLLLSLPPTALGLQMHTSPYPVCYMAVRICTQVLMGAQQTLLTRKSSLHQDHRLTEIHFLVPTLMAFLAFTIGEYHRNWNRKFGTTCHIVFQ